ncbi:hypothetical protein MKX07_004982 [Trichoderma sp. CBMAI-0711]|uniref:WSC domain-containing protein n=1 Tax=Trichoderma parareesei TaxID=858221 RepID=A0A2H2ZHD6_TRIPA|nr:hypothetical protein MKX07_004982 [Trichoderma sp. CBMAI-0711]OTA06353.1 hypothetical protein A9Z42_0070950 [Trichoderma parareesei]
MSRLLLLTGLLAASVAAQADHAAPGFKYIGCVEADAPSFPYKAVLSAVAPFSAEQCQHACHEKGKFAALNGEDCHCDESSPSSSSSGAEPQYKVLDESVCQIPCVEADKAAGFCGGPECPVSGKKRYTLYKKEFDDDECEKEHGDKKKDIGGSGAWNNNKDLPTKTATEVKTITSCPPEVTDCPLTAKAIDPPSTPITKHHHNAAAASAEAEALPRCPDKCGPPCPASGCPPCPFGNCPPPCPPGCPFAPPPHVHTKLECDGEHCKTKAHATASSSGVKLVTDPVASHAWPTSQGEVPTKVPDTINGGARYEAGVMMGVTALVMAVCLL